jgi:hypothetical protein
VFDINLVLPCHLLMLYWKFLSLLSSLYVIA